jgi:hypothetical protein
MQGFFYLFMAISEDISNDEANEVTSNEITPPNGVPSTYHHFKESQVSLHALTSISPP